MSATYDELLLTDLDRARSLLVDTEVSPASKALHTDEHITAVLDQEGSLEAGVAWLADELAGRYSRKPGKVTLPSGLSVTWAERVSFWKTLATRMRTTIATVAAEAESTPLSSQVVSTQAVW